MKLLVCDDHALFREGLLHVLRAVDEDAALFEAESAEQTLALVEQEDDLDLVLLDLGLPGVDGFAVLAQLREKHPTIPVVIVSASERPGDVRRALDGGAAGFIPKSSTGPVLRSALQLILNGGVYIPAQALDSGGVARTQGRGSRALPLTPRQLEVAELLARGQTNKEICASLRIAPGTVKAHIAAIFEALSATNRTEAAARLREMAADLDLDI